jgi:hypothetical protein
MRARMMATTVVAIVVTVLSVCVFGTAGGRHGLPMASTRHQAGGRSSAASEQGVQLDAARVAATGAGQAPACGSVILSGGSWLGGAGVDVHSNGEYQGKAVDCGSDSTTNPSVQDGNAWQCVELAARLYYVKGWGAVHTGGNGGAAYIPEGSPSLTFHPNGSGYIPVPGDLIIFNATASNPYGHVAVVDSVSGGIIYDVEQNASLTGTNQLSISGSTISGGVRGVEHSPKNTLTNSRTTASSTGPAVSKAANETDTFYVATNGCLYDAWWNPSTSGDSQIACGVADVAPAAVSKATSETDTFYVATNGCLYDAWWNPSTSGDSQIACGVADVAPAAVSKATSETDTFYVATNGCLYDAWSNSSTSGDSQIACGAAKFAPAAVSKAANETDTFYVATNGCLYDAWWNPSTSGDSQIACGAANI